jgi:hypothetical protein
VSDVLARIRRTVSDVLERRGVCRRQRVLNAVRTPCPPRAGGGGQQMQAACAKSGMLAGGLGAAQDGTHHELEGKDPHPRDKKNFNRISTTQKGLTSAGIPTELNESTAGVPTGFQQHKKD